MITKELFGKLPCGCEVYSYTVSNSSTTSFTCLNYGGILKNIFVPDKNGDLKDVIWGFDSLDSYVSSSGCQGALIGRFGNRIKNGKFTIDGVEYQLFQNDGNNTLHGGKVGFDKKLWNVCCIDGVEPQVILTYLSPDGEENFPGNLNVTVTYTLTSDGSISIHYEAETDKKTYVNLTNHSYFILGGCGSGLIDDCILYLDSDKINNVDNELIPDGSFINVKGTPYDFTTPARIGDGFSSDCKMMAEFFGYDNNFVFNDYDYTMKKRAVLSDINSGISMSLYTDAPCVQIYTGNMINLDDPAFKGNIPQYKHCGVCLETQAMPDSMNHPGFTDVLVTPDKKYDTTTIFKFNK